jgi:hypothetical protein
MEHDEAVNFRFEDWSAVGFHRFSIWDKEFVFSEDISLKFNRKFNRKKKKEGKTMNSTFGASKKKIRKSLRKKQKLCREWDLNPRQLRLVPKTSALDHSAISTILIQIVEFELYRYSWECEEALHSSTENRWGFHPFFTRPDLAKTNRFQCADNLKFQTMLTIIRVGNHPFLHYFLFPIHLIMANNGHHYLLQARK